MIQLEQQQHGEFVVGWGGLVVGGGLHQLTISSSLGFLTQNIGLWTLGSKTL